MGILDDPQTCNGIDNEWEPCSPELFASTDIAMHTIINDSQYLLPQLAPDGNYCPDLGIDADINGDGVVNILDIIAAVNILLSNEYQLNVDLNQDGFVNILDIILIVIIIQGE
jgi:hypothetical protein